MVHALPPACVKVTIEHKAAWRCPIVGGSVYVRVTVRHGKIVGVRMIGQVA